MARTHFAHRSFEQILHDAIIDEGFDPDTIADDDYTTIYEQLVEDMTEEHAQARYDRERGL